MAKSKIVEVLEKYGATNIKGYCLINNYGYTFELDGAEYDARFWANCYGFSPMRWDIHGGKESGKCDAKETPFCIPMEKQLRDRILAELNEIGDEG